MVNDSSVDALTGKALLKKVKELEHLSREEKAKACGYYTVTKKGVIRVNMMKFLNALVEADGIQIDSTQSGNGRGGRSASYRIKVQTNGNLLIGSAYTTKMGLQPGDEFEISLGRKHIRLTQLGSSDESPEDESPEEE
ncbi:MAG: AbrB family transcriptional regulator [Phormidesmis priestleyi]|uniref:AbrB family transcriptional regulator n=1 Tax=Phormidesmis priestleyi TaxID=268141 RepID=A0A2W4XBZ9_9CYAN|nr:MAG: AbrB family transcriptional regulator [Phormidesmis priestleyi]